MFPLALRGLLIKLLLDPITFSSYPPADAWSAEYFVQFPSAIFHRVTASDILSKEATMTDALMLEFDSKTVDSSELFDDRRAADLPKVPRSTRMFAHGCMSCCC